MDETKTDPPEQSPLPRALFVSTQNEDSDETVLLQAGPGRHLGGKHTR